ncbi:Cytochrome P450 family protein [Minicystis rosea]|nr:Cytochrome P450 family protein [Minicystis rosea]
MDFEAMPIAPGAQGLLGHLPGFRKERLKTLGLLSRQSTPMMRLDIPVAGIRALALNHPDVVQEALVEKVKHFHKSDMLRFGLYDLAGEGLFTSNGELWRRQRKLMAPLFTPRALEAYATDMVACTRRTMEGWRDGEELPLSRETTRLTMGIAGKTLFDADTFSEADEIGHALTIALDWTGWIVGRPFAFAHVVLKRMAERLAAHATGNVREALTRAEQRFSRPVVHVGTRGRELSRAIAFLDEHVQRMIDDRRRTAGTGRADLLSRLLEAHDEDDGAKMSDRQVRDEVLTLFVAGHETTATGLAWTIYLLCKHPEVLAATVREVDAVGDDPSVSDLPRLDLCLRVFKEALRLYPPVYVFGRDSKDPITLGGYDLPAPTNVLTSPWVLHHAARFWPDPERFDPDRFRPENEAARHRYAYLPFGAGPRICLGNHFAYMEAQLALATMLRRYTFELLAEDEPEPGATLRPKHGVRVRVRRRTHARAFVGEAVME